MKPSQCNFSGLGGGEQRRSCPPAAIPRKMDGGGERRGRGVVMVRTEETSQREGTARVEANISTCLVLAARLCSHPRIPIARTPDCPGA